MKFKVGDEVIINNNSKPWACINEYRKGKNLKNEIGKISRISLNFQTICTIVMIDCSYKKECDYFNHHRFCGTIKKSHIRKLNHLKLKKLIEHGV